MRYRGGGVGHVGTCVDPAPDDDDEWMDIDEPGDIVLQPVSGALDEDDEEEELNESENEIDEEQEEHLGPEDGEGEDKLEDDYDCL